MLQHKEMRTCKHTTGKEGEEEEAMRGARSGERKEKEKGWEGREISNDGVLLPRVTKLKYLVVNLTGMCSSCM